MVNNQVALPFEVSGLFYQRYGLKLRKYLDIRQHNSCQQQPELMVVMMNSGSSYPLDGVDNNQQPSMAKPDHTQQQIMRVMQNAGVAYARVLNLSDLREANSQALYQFLLSKQGQSIPHSIFATSRRKELQALFIKNVPVIFAWGVHNALKPLAKQAMQCLSVAQPLGLLKNGCSHAYYHPLPRIYRKQGEWVVNISQQLYQFY